MHQCKLARCTACPCMALSCLEGLVTCRGCLCGKFFMTQLGTLLKPCINACWLPSIVSSIL